MVLCVRMRNVRSVCEFDDLDTPFILVRLFLATDVIRLSFEWRLDSHPSHVSWQTQHMHSVWCPPATCGVKCDKGLSATHSLTKFAHFIDITALNMYEEMALCSIAHKSAPTSVSGVQCSCVWIIFIIICGAALSSLVPIITTNDYNHS